MAKNEEKGEIVLYQPEGEVRLEVRVENETVWLTQAQMAALFERERSVIAKHIKNVFKEGELDSKVVCANFAHTTPHGAIKGKMQISEVVLYNLDVIISVGYRVKSIAGTRFFLHIIMYIALCTRKGGITDHSCASGVVRFCL